MRKLIRAMILILVFAMLLLSGCGEVTLKDMFNDLREQGWNLDIYELQEDTLQLCNAVEGYYVSKVGNSKAYVLRLNEGVSYSGQPYGTMEELFDTGVYGAVIDLDGPGRIAAYTSNDNFRVATYDSFLRDLRESYNSRTG